MPRYAITERAGPFVAAHRNTGVGTVLELSERQAEHEVRLGSLVALPTATGNPEAAIAVQEPDDSEERTALQAEDADRQAPQPRKPKRSAT
jgi:hypothetical protein